MKAYKLVRKKKGKYYPLYVNTNEEFPVGEWIFAKNGEVVYENGKPKVKSKLGKLAYRPGLHLCEYPSETHIGKRGKSGKVEYLPSDLVWVLVEFTETICYQITATEMGRSEKTGKVNPRDAYMRSIPTNGFYFYNTSTSATVNWIIVGGMKIVREVPDEEWMEICKEKNLPYLERIA